VIVVPVLVADVVHEVHVRAVGAVTECSCAGHKLLHESMRRRHLYLVRVVEQDQGDERTMATISLPGIPRSISFCRTRRPR